MCTGLAVVGGRYLATRISEKTVTYIGGSLFLVFFLHSVLTDPMA
jgi:putative Ca2+/H+ antiporter (TMEM165/GDT1 family)